MKKTISKIDKKDKKEKVIKLIKEQIYNLFDSYPQRVGLVETRVVSLAKDIIKAVQ